MGAGQFSAQVIAALARGDRIQAMKLLRQAGGQGLKEAMIAIDSYASQTQGAASAPSREAIVAALRGGNTAEAIKRMRQANPGMDLHAAKQAVEALQQSLQPKASALGSAKPALHLTAKRTPTVVQGDSGGVGIIIAMLTIVAAVVAWWFLGT